MTEEFDMNVNLPNISDFENCLLEAYAKIEKRKLEFPLNLSEDNWSECVKSATAEFWKNIDIHDNIYFIFDDNEELLDVGKASSKNKYIRTRLKQHFIAKSEDTSSKITEVQKYVLHEQRLTLYVATLRVCPEKYYQMAETFYISHFNPPWNKRED